ncbi:MAG: N-acetylmannosamine kinase [Clostridiales bacterium]|nr:MAG: N-acetylmannosamine kinase [Clostridiales bacterium]
MQFLEDRKKNLSKSHRLIADYMLKNYDKAAFMTAARLGSVVGISESTVIRFAITLGFEGYPELQDALMKAAHNKMTVVQRMEVTKSHIGTSAVLKNVLQSDMETIRLTLENLDTQTFDAVVESIISARRIYIVGVRSSSALAEFLGFYFNLMFDNVNVVGSDGVSEVAEQIFHITQNDIIIGISYPRYSNRTLKALKFAKNKNATVIALTDSSSSPLCDYATYSLFAKSNITAFTDSLVAPLSLVNALISAVAIKKEQDLTSALAELEQIWDENKVYDKKD